MGRGPTFRCGCKSPAVCDFSHAGPVMRWYISLALRKFHAIFSLGFPLRAHADYPRGGPRGIFR